MRVPGSILHLHRRLLADRQAGEAQQRAEQEPLDRVVAYGRYCGNDERLVGINFSHETVAASLQGEWTVQIASDGRGEEQPFTGELAPLQGLLPEPRG